MTRKGLLITTTSILVALASCDRDGTGANESSQEIQTIDGVPTVASDDPMYLACIEEAKSDAQRSLEGGIARSLLLAERPGEHRRNDIYRQCFQERARRR